MISIIICHHKGTLLYQTLESVYASQDAVYEVIVVSSLYLDNPILKYARAKWKEAKFIQCEGGPDVKRNLGAKYAKGYYLAFFDDDVELTRSALS